MRGLDNAAINTFKVPSLELMENAGRRTVDIMLDKYGDPQARELQFLSAPATMVATALLLPGFLLPEWPVQ